MNCYCTRCEINWSRLLTCESEGEEQTEVCPLCLTDSFLQEGKEADKYFMCAVTAKVIEVNTKQELNRTPVVEMRPEKERPSFEVTRLEYERRETRALDAYHRSGKAEDYHKSFK